MLIIRYSLVATSIIIMWTMSNVFRYTNSDADDYVELYCLTCVCMVFMHDLVLTLFAEKTTVLSIRTTRFIDS